MIEITYKKNPEIVALIEQVRLLTERLDKMENRFVKTTYELYSVTDIKNGDVHTMCTSVPGGLNDAELLTKRQRLEAQYPPDGGPVTHITVDKDGCATFRKCVKPQTLGQAATAGCDWMRWMDDNSYRHPDAPEIEGTTARKKYVQTVLEVSEKKKQAATAGYEWDDVKCEQTTRKCDRPPGM